MTFTSLVSMAGAFALVLGLLVLAMMVLKRTVPRFARGGKAIELAVVQRVGLGARQGLAVVRIAERTLLISVGDGGVRLVTELTAKTIGRVDG